MIGEQKSEALPLSAFLPSVSESPDETTSVGRMIATSLVPGDVVALYGDLGTGKTLLAKGICDGLGIPPDLVTSPTFSLINEYRAGELPVYHFDTYRLKSVDEFLALGYEDYFFGDGISIVEWPKRIEEYLPADTIRVRLLHLGANRRRIEVLRADR